MFKYYQKIKELLESAKSQLSEGAATAEERNCDISDFINAEKDIDEALEELEKSIFCMSNSKVVLP